MKRLVMITAAVATSVGLLALNAQASGPDTKLDPVPPQAEWMSIADLSTKLEGLGYQVREIEIEDGVYEVEMTDANGLEVEGYLHPVTGEVLPDTEDKDDDD